MISKMGSVNMNRLPSNGDGVINALAKLVLARSFPCRVWQKRHGAVALRVYPDVSSARAACKPVQKSRGKRRPVRAIYWRYSSTKVSTIICSSLAIRPKNKVPNPIRPAKPATQLGSSNA